jgi:hypothetical protein
MNIKEMTDLCYAISGMSTAQIRVLAHEVLEEYEYIDFVDLKGYEPRPKHRIRKFNGIWKFVY